MENTVIPINSARPERWRIDVSRANQPSVDCFYSRDSQCWVGVVSAQSMETLSAMLSCARNAMRSARERNTRVEVTL